MGILDSSILKKGGIMHKNLLKVLLLGTMLVGIPENSWCAPLDPEFSSGGAGTESLLGGFRDSVSETAHSAWDGAKNASAWVAGKVDSLFGFGVPEGGRVDIRITPGGGGAGGAGGGAGSVATGGSVGAGGSGLPSGVEVDPSNSFSVDGKTYFTGSDGKVYVEGPDGNYVSADATKGAGEGVKGAGDGAGGAAESTKGASDGAKGGGANGGTANGPFAPIEIFNVPQYILLIMEAKEGQKTDDATKEVTVKGAEPMQQSQGSQGGGASTSMAPLPSSEMAGTTIAGAASAMATLLNLGKIDISLLSTDIEKPEEGESAPAVRASNSSSQADVSASEVETQSPVKKMNTQEQREIMHRRALLLSEWAAAALQIGEGSNAISGDFYARAAGFSAAASGAQGSMGGINTITDSDRFVLFELTRGAALSAVQLGLQGAANLNTLDEVMEEPAPARTPGISASTSSSQ